jgi:hypothetical protein
MIHTTHMNQWENVCLASHNIYGRKNTMSSKRMNAIVNETRRMNKDPIVGTMSRIATLPVPGKEWNPTEDLDTRRNGEAQMCAKLRECGIRVNLTAVVAILRLPPTRAFSQDELASTALPLPEKSDNESTSTSESRAGGASRDS